MTIRVPTTYITNDTKKIVIFGRVIDDLVSGGKRNPQVFDVFFDPESTKTYITYSGLIDNYYYYYCYTHLSDSGTSGVGTTSVVFRLLPRNRVPCVCVKNMYT